MKTSTKILTTLAVLAAMTTGAWALQRNETRLLMGERLAELGISAAQKQQIKSVLRQHQPTVEPMVHQLVAERRKLRDTIRADQIGEKAIRAQAAAVAGIEADLAVQRAQIVHELKPVLTADQIAKLRNMQADFDERMDGFLARVANRIAND